MRVSRVERGDGYAVDLTKPTFIDSTTMGTPLRTIRPL
jgi:hypothetical protein